MREREKAEGIERTNERESSVLHARHCCTFMFVFVGGPQFARSKGDKRQKGARTKEREVARARSWSMEAWGDGQASPGNGANKQQ